MAAARMRPESHLRIFPTYCAVSLVISPATRQRLWKSCSGFLLFIVFCRQPKDASHRCYALIENSFGLMDGPDGEMFENWFERCIANLAELTPEARRENCSKDGEVRKSGMELNPYNERIRLSWGNEFAGRCALVFGPADYLEPLHKIFDQPQPHRITVVPLTALIKFAGLLAAPSPPRAATPSRSEAGATTIRPGGETPDLTTRSGARLRPASHSARATR